MSKAQRLRSASVKLEEAIAKLKRAKTDLLHARSEHHGRLVFALTELEEIYEILNDSECTPEKFEDAPDPDYDDCRWDGDRIEATKTVLFREYVGER